MIATFYLQPDDDSLELPPQPGCQDAMMIPFLGSGNPKKNRRPFGTIASWGGPSIITKVCSNGASARHEGSEWRTLRRRGSRVKDRHQYKALPLMMGVDGIMCNIYRMTIWLYRLRSCFFLKHFFDSFLSLSHVSLEENNHISKSWKHYSYITRTYMNVYNIDTQTHADTLNSFSISVHIHFNNFSTFFLQ